MLTDATDADGDLLSYSFTWEVDGIAYTDAVYGVFAGDTVASGETFAGENWTCAATASDGSASGAAGEESVAVGADVISGSVSVTHSASGIDFVTIYAGSFEMGCTPGQLARSCAAASSPVMPVRLTRSFYMGRTEVTQSQYQGIMGTNPANNTSCGGTCPVEQVSWHMAAAFANAVSTASSLPRCYTCTGSGASTSCTAPADPYACSGYRLPTEAEAEAAARCGTDLLYAGSNIVEDVSWYTGNSGGRTRPVAGLAPNTCGLYDMSGNVKEWTGDWVDTSYYITSGRTDPTGPATGTMRVYRGGGYDNSGGTVSGRGYGSAVSGPSTGFRLVRTDP